MNQLVSPRIHGPTRIGLLAGAGSFPVSVARELQEQGYEVFAMGVLGMVGDELEQYCRKFSKAPLARLGTAIRFFKSNQIGQVMMAGKIEKTVLFQPNLFWRMMPDWRTIHMWLTYASENKKDDTLLLAVIREFERDKIEFCSAVEYCPSLLVDHGFLTRKKPSDDQWKDIRFGWEIAKEMGRMDIGQSIVVNDMAVIAVEAIEGTDRAIIRAGELCRRKSFTVVKVAKPQQDMRFDVPTIGVRTIKTMQESGGRVLAIEAGKTIILDQNEVIDLANRLGIIIVAVNDEEIAQRNAA
jgi:hypothetical protein